MAAKKASKELRAFEQKDTNDHKVLQQGGNRIHTYEVFMMRKSRQAEENFGLAYLAAQ